MHELQQILLQKLPRLGELTFWCIVRTYLFNWNQETHFRFVYKTYKSNIIVCENNDSDQVLLWEGDYEIIGHKPSHADILEALGEDWAMTGDYQLLSYRKWTNSWNTFTIQNHVVIPYPKLPQNLSDLSLSKYEETRKQLIQLLTK